MSDITVNVPMGRYQQLLDRETMFKALTGEVDMSYDTGITWTHAEVVYLCDVIRELRGIELVPYEDPPLEPAERQG